MVFMLQGFFHAHNLWYVENVFFVNISKRIAQIYYISLEERWVYPLSIDSQ